MSKRDQILSHMKNAMKNGEKLRQNVLRMLLSEIKYAQSAIDIKVELEEKEVLSVITSYHKKLTKSLKDFPAGPQKDELEEEIKIVEEYLPPKVTLKEMEETVDRHLAQTDNPSFGLIIKEVLKELGPMADAKIISQMIKKKAQEKS